MQVNTQKKSGHVLKRLNGPEKKLVTFVLLVV